MSRFPAIFERVARDLTITTDDGFEHATLGRFEPTLRTPVIDRPALAEPARTGPEPPAGLWLFVYRYYHTGDRAGALRMREPLARVRSVTNLADSTYVDRLRAANGGSAYWDGGWTLETNSAGATVVQRDGVRLHVQPSELRQSDGSAVVAVRLPGERPYASAGFHLFIGNAGSCQVGREEIVRYYFNLVPDGMPPLVKRLTSFLNHAALPFQLKVLNNPAAFTRRDAAVLYVQADAVASVAPLVERTHEELVDSFRRGTPGFARPLALGLATAHEMRETSGRLSFGQHRSLLVAEGLAEAFAAGLDTPAGRFAAIAARYEREGLDVRWPYRNRS